MNENISEITKKYLKLRLKLIELLSRQQELNSDDFEELSSIGAKVIEILESMESIKKDLNIDYKLFKLYVDLEENTLYENYEECAKIYDKINSFA